MSTYRSNTSSSVVGPGKGFLPGASLIHVLMLAILMLRKHAPQAPTEGSQTHAQRAGCRSMPGVAACRVSQHAGCRSMPGVAACRVSATDSAPRDLQRAIRHLGQEAFVPIPEDEPPGEGRMRRRGAQVAEPLQQPAYLVCAGSI